MVPLPGTEEAETWGEAEEEVLISVDPYRLAAAKLTSEQVAAAILAADTKLPSGRLRGSSDNNDHSDENGKDLVSSGQGV